MNNRAFRAVLRSAAVFSCSHQKNVSFCGAGRPRTERGFTFMELLVVIATVGLLGVMCLSVLATAQGDTQAFQCMNNHKQLMVAFRMYASDNSDVMVSSIGGGSAYRNGRPNFVAGELSFTTAQANWDPNVYLVPSPLWRYLQKAEIFRCPSDPVLINVTSPPAGFSKGQYPRIRTISLNFACGPADWLPPSAWKTYSRYSDFDLPATIFTFVDEHPNSINDVSFQIMLDPPSAFDITAPFHNGGRASGISFADGHAEIHQWRGSLIDAPYVPGNTSSFVLASRSPVNPNDRADVSWLASHTTVPR